MANMKAYWSLVATIIVSIVIGMFLGSRLFPKNTTSVVTTTKYVYRPAVHFDGVNPAPLSVRKIDMPHLGLVDTVLLEVPADTAAILADYCLKRDYLLDFSTDSTGVFKVNVGVAYNRICDYSADIQPLERQTETTQTLVKQRLLRPYVGGSVAVYGGRAIGAEAGVLLKEHHAVGLEYQMADNKNMLKVKYAYFFK